MRGSVPGSRIGVWVALAASLAAATLFVAVKVTTPSDGGRVAFYEHAWTADGRPHRPHRPAAARPPGRRRGPVDRRPVDGGLGRRPARPRRRPGRATGRVRTRSRGPARSPRSPSPGRRPVSARPIARGVERRRPLDRPRGDRRLRARSTAHGTRRCGARARCLRRRRQQRPVVPRDHHQRPGAGRPVPVPRAPDGRPVHGHVAGGGPPRARVPEPASRGRAPARGSRGCRTRSRSAPMRPPSPAPGSRPRPRSSGSARGRGSSSRSSCRVSWSGWRWPSMASSGRAMRWPAAGAAGRSSGRPRARSPASSLFQVPELVLGRSLVPASWIGLIALPLPARPGDRHRPRPPVRHPASSSTGPWSTAA